MTHGKPYSIHKRGKVWYSQFRLPDGKWTTAKTTNQTSKGMAERWCIDYLSDGQIVRHEHIKLREFANGFFDWEGSWATDKRVRGLRISQRHCKERTELLTRHILPVMGNKKLTEIDRGAIKEFRNSLFSQGYSGSSINHVLSALKSVLESAEEQSLIKYTPRIDRAANNPKQKGILTIEEVQKLFAFEWTDFRGYVGNLLAATTGLRMGELLALTHEDINLIGGFINVRRSWDTRLKTMNETTKTGKARNIFIPVYVQEEVRSLIENNPYPVAGSRFLFYGLNQNLPVDWSVLRRSLRESLKAIGINNDERKRRNVTFHSWRHWLNSLLINAKIPLQKIQSMTGHLTAEMTQHYYHLDDMTDVLQIQSSIFTLKETEQSVKNI